MKIVKKIWLSGILGILLLSSCQNFDQYLKDQFPETDTSTYVMLDGTFALPLIDSKITLAELLPDMDTSSVWIEADANDVLHLMIKQSGAYSLTAEDAGITNDLPTGYVIPADITIPPAWMDPLMNFDLFNDMPPGLVYFDDPKITLIVRSELALEMSIDVDSGVFVNNADNATVYSDCNETINLSPNGSDTVVFDNANLTNLSDGLAIYPDQIGVKFGITIPSQTTAGDVATSDQVFVDYLVDLPMQLYVKDLVVTDTSEINLGGDATQMIKDLTLKVVDKNGMALGASLFIVFTDSLYQDTIATIKQVNAPADDTLTLPFANGARTLNVAYVLDPCETDIAGNTLPAENVVHYISLPQYAIDAINKYKPNRMIIGVKFNTYNSSLPQVVKIKSEDYIDLKIGAKIVFEAKTK